MTRRAVVAVVGANSPQPRARQVAEELGRALVDAGFRVATGGLGGVMEAACRGARSSDAYAEGMTIGVLPGLDARAANEFVDIVIPTGMSFARNVLLVAMADAVVGVAGGAGTLSELALAWQHGKPIVVLDAGEGWSTELAGRALDARRDEVLRRVETAEEAVLVVAAAVRG